VLSAGSASSNARAAGHLGHIEHDINMNEAESNGQIPL
jgi:hypothetical protein